MKPATKTAWQCKPLPSRVNELLVERLFNEEEINQIKLGIIPQQMEDKWFVYYEGGILNFHRSWTGHQIFKVYLSETDEGIRIEKVIVNRDISEYNQTDDNYDMVFLNFLIDRLLLGKNVSFPKPADVEDEKQTLYQFAMIGYGRSNKER